PLRSPDLCDERLYDGHHATQFLVPRHTLRSRTGGLAADVDDVGALRDQVEPVLDGLVRIEPGPAVGEGVGGDVDHAHDEASPWRGQTRHDGTGHVTQPYACSQPPGAGPPASSSSGAARRLGLDLLASHTRQTAFSTPPRKNPATPANFP